MLLIDIRDNNMRSLDRFYIQGDIETAEIDIKNFFDLVGSNFFEDRLVELNKIFYVYLEKYNIKIKIDSFFNNSQA